MKKISLLFAVLMGFAVAVHADNLVKNGDFKHQTSKGVAFNWSPFKPKDAVVKYFTSGAPNGGYAQFVMPTAGNFSLRQNMTPVLRPNTKYKISFKVRGRDFTAKALGMLFINEGWSKDAGVKNLTATPEWKEYKLEFATPDYNRYVFLTFFGNTAKGTIEVADIEVKAINVDN